MQAVVKEGLVTVEIQTRPVPSGVEVQTTEVWYVDAETRTAPVGAAARWSRV